jgi:acyl-CoA reductase-like NAD-dependent aldehyde dehydrogenase
MADRAKAEGWHTPLPPQEHAQVRKALIALKGVLPAPAREALLAECLARTVCAEAGKPIKQARGEVARCIDTFSFAAAEARKLAGTLVPMDASAAGANKLAYIIREPIGVVGAISPFNFPLNLVSHKLAPAVAAGCPVVLKPASNTPLSGLAPAGILMEAGLPAGYLTVVVGGGESVGNAIVDHPDVRMTSFTGSPPVGWEIRRRQPRKEVTLELGNATPVLVAADADLDRAATKLAASGYRHAGQSCISVQRV